MTIKERLAKLIDVKSIVTFIITITFCVLAFKSVITGDQVNNVFMMVISFFFGTQAAKPKTDNQKGE